MINKTTPQPSLFGSLTDLLNSKHPLYYLPKDRLAPF